MEFGYNNNTDILLPCKLYSCLYVTYYNGVALGVPGIHRCCYAIIEKKSSENLFSHIITRAYGIFISI